jgi:hypothetical protein
VVVVFRKHFKTISVYIAPNMKKWGLEGLKFAPGVKFGGIEFAGAPQAVGSPRGQTMTFEQAHVVFASVCRAIIWRKQNSHTPEKDISGDWNTRLSTPGEKISVVNCSNCIRSIGCTGALYPHPETCHPNNFCSKWSWNGIREFDN